ncbi:MAG: cysteine desulfurase [Alphaproteobacteria bacterium]|nr:MAG: cysteine desulfurase [Alphaproteobacteria bacterium]
MHYLDHNASAPLRPEARLAMEETAAIAGNPSSVHAAGRAARARLEDARERVAGLIGAAPETILFTSGGTESAALAMAQAANGCTLVLTSAIEHPCVLENAKRGAIPMASLPVNADGRADLDALEVTLTDAPGPVFVALMLANNESGVVQPVDAAARLVHEHGGRIFCDAVQAAGKMPVDVEALGVDYLSLSAHKIGGPAGIGALYLRPGTPFVPLWGGGGQERRLRTGTENRIGAAGFGAAAKAAGDRLGSERARIAALRERLESRLHAIAPDLHIFGEAVERLPNTTLFAVPGRRAETLVMQFDLAGVCVSSGSACSSGKVEPSHVVAAMTDDPALARAAIRVSLGWNSSEADVDAFLSAAEHIFAGSRAGMVAEGRS